MTFLHKLAKRLAQVYPAAALLSLLAGSCSEGRPEAYLGPDPHKPVNSSYIGLSITPRDILIAPSDSVRFEAYGWLSTGESVPAQVTWAATGGTISSNGWFRSGGLGIFQVRAIAASNAALRDSGQVVVSTSAGMVRLDITPATAAPPAGTQQQFTAVALMRDGSTRLPAVTWSATGGTITSTGLFTSAATPGGFSVVAKLIDGVLVGRVEGTVTTPVLTQLALEPVAVSLESGETHLFAATALWSDGSTSLPPLSWNGTGGTTLPDGHYTAGQTAGSFRVTVSNQSLKKADTANVNIRPRIVRVRVAPGSALLAVGASLAMQAYALRSDGTEGPVAAQWTAQGGAIQTNGTYTAGTVPGGYEVVGTVRTSGGQAFADSAEIQVGSIPTTLQQLVLSPSSTTLQVGQTAQFSIATSWSDGSSATAPVTWTATGGTITAGGAYTAGTNPGAYRVIATQQGGGKADTSAVTVTAVPAPVVSSFTVSPHRDTLQAGQGRQFSATLTWNDGQSHPVTISWLSAGGTITQSGAFTAGSLAGSFLVIATCSCGAVDTAVVVVPSAPIASPTLTSLSLTPPTTTIAPGATLQFLVSGSWSDGASSVPAVQFSPTGGTISPSGLYTAGATPGSYRVIAVQVGGTLADTSVITIQTSGSGPTLTQLVLNPSAATVASGGTQQFVVSASWSDGSSTVPPVVYTATGGTVTTGGLYTAGTTAGTYRVIVTQQGGTKADTSTVTIPTGVTLTQLVLNPSTVTLAPGATQQFIVTGSWSDGSGTAPAVTYTAGGGTITSGGLYTAGSAAGTYQLIARHTGGTRADTSVVTIAAAPPPPPPGPVVPALPRLLNTGYSAPTGPVVNVPAGGDLQAALNNASCGTEIRLAPGATYRGNYTLPAKACSSNLIHLRGASILPPEGVRIDPAVAVGFAKLISPNADAALKAASGARGYRIVATEFTVDVGPSINYGIVSIGTNYEDQLATMAGDLILDRVFIHGHSTLQVKRCLALNGVSTAIIDSYLSDCHGKGFDAQAIAGWAGPGPYKIVNNYLEGSGENLIFGGAPTGLAGSPSDIEIRRNYLYKPITWLASKAWNVKNLLELKNAVRVLVEGNVLQNNWADAQSGFAILFQSLNDGAGTNATTTASVQDVTFRLNHVISSGSGMSILAEVRYPGDGPTLPVSRVLMENNLFEDIGRADLLGEGKMLMFLGGIRGLALNHNTFLHSQTPGTQSNSAIILAAAPTPISPLIITNSLFSGGTYGLQGDNAGIGTVALNMHANPWTFLANAMTGQNVYPYGPYPDGNYFPSTVSALQLNQYMQVGSGSGLVGAATDHTDVGANISVLRNAILGVAPQ